MQFLYLNLLSILVSSAPHFHNSPRPPFPYPNEEAAIDDFRTYMPFAFAANCEQTWINQTFPRGNDFESAHPTTLVNGLHDIDSGASAMVAFNEHLESIIITFRPTITKMQVFEDLKIWRSEPFALNSDTILTYFKSVVSSSKEIANQATDKLEHLAMALNLVESGNSTDFKMPPDAFLHHGFQNLYNLFRNDTLMLTVMLAKRFPTYKIVYTGHSLGGAMAQIAAVDFSIQTNMSSRIWVFPFASPRVGNRAWAEFENQQEFARLGQVHRLVRYGDPIPTLPPRFFGYRHAYTEHTIWNDLTISKCPDQKTWFGNSILGGECDVNQPYPSALDMNLHAPRKYMSYLGLQFNCSAIGIDESPLE